jgi:hypothetical protein
MVAKPRIAPGGLCMSEQEDGLHRVDPQEP